MEENYITASETVILFLWLTGPELFIGHIWQFFFYKNKGIFINNGRGKYGRWIACISIPITTSLVIIFTAILWVVTPFQFQSVITENGFTIVPFLPAIISSVLIFPLISRLVVFIFGRLNLKQPKTDHGA